MNRRRIIEIKSKRGNINDILLAIVLLFAIAIAMVPVWQTFDTIAGALNQSPSIGNNTKEILAVQRANLPPVLDYTYAFVFFGAFLAIIVAAYLIRSSALFFVIATILIAIFAFISAVLSNTYNDYLATNSVTADYAEKYFPMTNHLMNNFPIYVVIMGFLAAIFLYAKVGSGGSGV